MKGKWENQEWDYSQALDTGEVYVTVTEVCIQHGGKCDAKPRKKTFMLIDGEAF